MNKTSEVPTPDEMENLRRETAASLQNFEQKISSIDVSRWTVRVTATEWSPSEITEHVLLTNERLLSAVASRRHQSTSAGWREDTACKENWIRTMLASAGKAKASAGLSTFSGLKQHAAGPDLRGFISRFDEFLTEARDAPLHAITWPNAFAGELSAYQWLLYIPFHTRRHELQLQRTEASLNETRKDLRNQFRHGWHGIAVRLAFQGNVSSIASAAQDPKNPLKIGRFSLMVYVNF